MLLSAALSNSKPTQAFYILCRVETVSASGASGSWHRAKPLSKPEPAWANSEFGRRLANLACAVLVEHALTVNLKVKFRGMNLEGCRITPLVYRLSFLDKLV